MQVSRVFFGLWSLLFLLFAYWQWNDPDPEVWVSIYCFGAIVSSLAAAERYYVPLFSVAAIAAFLGGLYFFPSSVREWIVREWQQGDLSMKTQDMEVARESFGLFIVSVVVGLATYKGWIKNRSEKKQN